MKTKLSGCCTRLFQSVNSQTKSILVKLYPWAINAFFNDDAHYFTNHAWGLAEVIGDLSSAEFKEQLATALRPSDLFYTVEKFLLNLLKINKKKHLHNHIIDLTQRLSNFENIDSIAELARNYNLSQRNLERQFKNIIGLSPKKFIRLSQFRKTLHQLYNGASWEQIVDDLNYYDQAHFINSFKQFSGLAPSQFKNFHTHIK